MGTPECTPALYPFPYGHPCCRQAMVNVECLSTNPSVFSRFNPTNEILDGNVYRGVLAPGQILYIPNGWWLEYKSLNEMSTHLMLESAAGRRTETMDWDQVLNRKTAVQRVIIGRNVERK